MHESSPGPEAKFMRKENGQPEKLSFRAHPLMENRDGWLINLAINDATLAES